MAEVSQRSRRGFEEGRNPLFRQHSDSPRFQGPPPQSG